MLIFEGDSTSATSEKINMTDRKQGKAFIFLYPETDIFDFEINGGAYSFSDKEKERQFKERIDKSESDEEKEAIRAEAVKEIRAEFRQVYSSKLNQCIDARYRRNGFSIFYAIFDGSHVSDVLDVRPEDKVIQVGMDEITHRTKRPDGTYPYPKRDYIIDQMEPLDTLWVGGFHMWDCVRKLAIRAHQRGIATLVDEDLTEFFASRIKRSDFRIEEFPGYNPKSEGERNYSFFMRPRKGKPWYYQKY